jgi:DNA-binding transcriptional MerR regulator
MRIATVAERLGISPDWLRRLERQGHIPRASRDRNGHRRYEDADVMRLRGLILDQRGDGRGAGHL